jgi:hypothetical protein
LHHQKLQNHIHKQTSFSGSGLLGENKKLTTIKANPKPIEINRNIKMVA